MSEHYYDHDPTLCLVYFDILVPCVIITSLITILPALIKYMKSKDGTNTYLFWSGLIFFLTLIICLITMIFSSIFFCRNESVYIILYNIKTTSYVIQQLLLLGLLFGRLYYVFHSSLFALSQSIIRSYWIFYVFMFIISIAAGICYANFRTIIGVSIVILALTLNLIQIICLISLFLYKTMQVYTSVDKLDSNSPLIALITKTSVLAFISIFATLIDAIGTIILPFILSVHILMITRLLLIFDLVTNFWCIILAYRGYDALYMKICAHCDLKCGTYWQNFAKRKTQDVMMITAIQSNKSVGSETGAGEL